MEMSLADKDPGNAMQSIVAPLPDRARMLGSIVVNRGLLPPTFYCIFSGRGTAADQSTPRALAVALKPHAQREL
jgi:hypothetical protein